jgi:hypothetical protein
VLLISYEQGVTETSDVEAVLCSTAALSQYVAQQARLVSSSTQLPHTIKLSWLLGRLDAPPLAANAPSTVAYWYTVVLGASMAEDACTSR